MMNYYHLQKHIWASTDLHVNDLSKNFCHKKQNNIKALICLAAGDQQFPLIKIAKTMGYYIFAVDRNPFSKGFILADKPIVVSSYDADAIIFELEKIFSNDTSSYSLLGIINRSSGPPVITAAKLSRHFNIPGVPVSSALKILNKADFRSSASSVGIPTPEYWVLKEGDKFEFAERNFPFVVKPALSLRGKSGITIVRKVSQLNHAIKLAFENTINGSIIIESYLSGQDVVVIGFVQDGDLTVVGNLIELNKETEFGTVVGTGFKTDLSGKASEIFDQVNKIAHDIVAKYLLVRSPFMASFRSDHTGDVFPIEIHLDIGGDQLLEKFFPAAYPIDFRKLCIEAAVGGNIAKFVTNPKPTAIMFRPPYENIAKEVVKVLQAGTQEKLEELILDG